jgi:ferredoxin
MARPLGYRILRFGLRAASRAASDAVGVALKPARGESDAAPEPAPTRRAPRGKAVTVCFEGQAEGPVERGVTVLEAARSLGIDIDSYCGGNCSCGTCRVEVVGSTAGLSKLESMERMVLGPTKVEAGDRLACQTRILGEATILVPEWF